MRSIVCAGVGVKGRVRERGERKRQISIKAMNVILTDVAETQEDQN